MNEKFTRPEKPYFPTYLPSSVKVLIEKQHQEQNDFCDAFEDEGYDHTVLRTQVAQNSNLCQFIFTSKHPFLADKQNLLLVLSVLTSKNTNSSMMNLSNGYLDHIPVDLRYDKDILTACIGVLENEEFASLPLDVVSDSLFMHNAVLANPTHYTYLSPELKSSVAFNLKLIENDASIYERISPEIANHRDVATLYFSKIDPVKALRNLHKLERNHAEMLGHIVNAAHRSSQPLDDMKEDISIAISNLRDKGIDKLVTGDKSCVSALIDLSPFALKFAAVSLRDDSKLAKQAIQNFDRFNVRVLSTRHVIDTFSERLQRRIANNDPLKALTSIIAEERLETELKVAHTPRKTRTLKI